MNKQELQNEINKTKEHLANMEKMLAGYEYEKWKPQKGEEYYYANIFGNVLSTEWQNTQFAKQLWLTNNCFQTYEQAKAEIEKILIRRQLEDIASRLNKGEKINWKRTHQVKYYLRYNIAEDRLDIDLDFNMVRIGVTYCLSNEFLNVAIREIDKEKLKRYLRGE